MRDGFAFSVHLWVHVIISAGIYKCCLGDQTAVKIQFEKKDIRMHLNASPRCLSKSSFFLLLLSLLVLTDTAPILSSNLLSREDILGSFLRVAASINNITAVSMAFNCLLALN